MRSRPVAPPGGGAGGEGAPAGGPGGGGFGGGFANLGFRVDPGDYTVKIKLGEKELSKPLRIAEDPRINLSAEDRAKKRAALNKLQPIVTQAQLATTSIAGLRTNVTAAIESCKSPDPLELQDHVTDMTDDLLI